MPYFDEVAKEHRLEAWQEVEPEVVTLTTSKGGVILTVRDTPPFVVQVSHLQWSGEGEAGAHYQAVGALLAALETSCSRNAWRWTAADTDEGYYVTITEGGPWVIGQCVDEELVDAFLGAFVNAFSNRDMTPPAARSQ